MDVLDFLKWMFINMMVATAILFLAAYPPFLRFVRNRGRLPWRSIVAASLMSVFAMLFPWEVSNNAQLDLRLAPMLLLGWLYGWRATVPVAAVLILVRWLIGGPGFIPSIPYTLSAIPLVPFFTGRPRTAKNLAALGILQTAVGFVVGRIMVHPQPPEMEWYSPVWPLLAATFVVSLWVFNAAYELTIDKYRLQRTLKWELALKEAILELIPHAILFLDEQRRVTHCNQAARPLLEGGQVPATFLAHPEIDRALRRQERVSGCRVAYAGPEGERIVLVSAVPMEGGGAVLGVENVTGVVRQEREEAMRERLELLGRLAAMAAHEIKNPLTTIKGFVQLLGRKPEVAPYASSIALVEGEVAHIQRVVDDFLLLAGHRAEPATLVDLDRLLQEVLSGVALQFPEGRVRMALDGEPGLMVTADAQSLKQILRNLVANACEAMGGEGDLIIRRERQGDRIAIVVSDTGPGIPPDVLPVIFRPFMTTKPTGTGLGLAISHKLAAEMGGELTAASEEGRGSTFTLLLPLTPPVPS